MNPIENVWGNMVQEMESYKVESAEEVFERASAVWEGFKQSPEYWRKLASSMSRRLALFVMHDLCIFVDRVSESTERRKKMIVLKTIDMEIGIYRYKPLYYRY